MNAVTGRRKGVTYGRAHRKALGNANFLPDATLQSTWRTQGSDPPKPGSRPLAKTDHGTNSSTLPYTHQAYEAGLDNAPFNTHRSNVELAVYEFNTSSDEISIAHVPTLVQPSGKRRKHTPADAPKRLDHDLPALDGHELEKKPSVEIEGASTKMYGRTSNGRGRALYLREDSDKGLSPEAQCPPGILGAQLALAGPKNTARKIMEQQKPSTDIRIEPRGVRCTQPKEPSHKGTVKREMRSVTPLPSQSEQTDLPVTPPRSTSRCNPASLTPRQRVMWDRLLTPQRSNRCHSQLYVLGRAIAKAGSESDDEYLKASDPHSNRNKSGPSRPQRLIDLLNASKAHVRSTVLSRSDEDRMRNSSDDESRTDEFVPLKRGNLWAQQASPDPSNRDIGSSSVDEMASSQPRASSCGDYLTRGAKVTYAQPRSYLTDCESSGEAILKLEPLTANKAQSRSRRQGVAPPSSCSSVDEYDIDEDQDGQGGVMRSVHELREAGGYARLLGELESLLDELGEQGAMTAVPCTALIRLALKLREPSNARLFVDRGFETRLTSHICSTSGSIIRSLGAMIILLLLMHSSSPVLVSRMNEEQPKQFLLDLLGSTHDLRRKAQGREANLAKTAQREFIDVADFLLNAPVWHNNRPPYLSCQALGLQCLHHLVEWTQPGDAVTEFLSVRQLQQLVQNSVLEGTVPLDSDSMEKYSLRHAVFIIEKAAIFLTMASKTLTADGVLNRITHILPKLSTDDSDSALQLSTLHLYSNVTQSQPGLCGIFVQSRAIAMMTEVITLNKVILSLSCLMNIAEVSQSMRKQSIMRNAENISMLESLLALFVNHSRIVTEVYSEEEATSNIPFGYLAALISFLCLDLAVKAQAESLLPDRSIKPLLDVVGEFMRYHKAITTDNDQDGLVDGQLGFVDRVQALLSKLAS